MRSTNELVVEFVYLDSLVDEVILCTVFCEERLSEMSMIF